MGDIVTLDPGSVVAPATYLKAEVRVRDGDSDPGKAAAAFHAEQIVTDLLAQFVALIADIEQMDGVLVIEFKPPRARALKLGLRLGR